MNYWPRGQVQPSMSGHWQNESIQVHTFALLIHLLAKSTFTTTTTATTTTRVHLSGRAGRTGRTELIFMLFFESKNENFFLLDSRLFVSFDTTWYLGQPYRDFCCYFWSLLLCSSPTPPDEEARSWIRHDRCCVHTPRTVGCLICKRTKNNSRQDIKARLRWFEAGTLGPWSWPLAWYEPAEASSEDLRQIRPKHTLGRTN